jgi:magnesium transporter
LTKNFCGKSILTKHIFLGKNIGMLEYYKTINNTITKLNNYEDGCWINCVAPLENEINYLISKFNISMEFLKSALDEEETSNVDYEKGTTILIIDTPVVERFGNSFTYFTQPLSIIVNEKFLITISLQENTIINEFSEGFMRNMKIDAKADFILNIILRTINKYLKYLKQIDKISSRVEQELKKTMRNKDLVQLLEIEKSLVYLSASLKSVNLTLQKLAHEKYIDSIDKNDDVLEEVFIEIKQAIEMSEIYLSITSSSMNAFSSIISNNLNDVMKILASITLLISIPTVISGIYGMNTPNFPMMEHWWFPLMFSVAIIAIVWRILKKNGML